MENTPETAAKNFRNRFFIWSILFIVLMLMINAIWVELIIFYNSPIISSNDPRDLAVFEEWLGISFPEGSILRKMHYLGAWQDSPGSASLLVSIPKNRLRQFEKDLPSDYVLQDKMYDYVDEYIIGDITYNEMRIYQIENGDNLVFIHKEEPSDQVRELIYKNIGKGNYNWDPESIQATSADGKYTVMLSRQDFCCISADLIENLGENTTRSTWILTAIYDNKPLELEWIGNDSIMICGYKINLSECINALEDSPIIQRLD